MCDPPVIQGAGTDPLAASYRTELLFQPGKWWKEDKPSSRPRKKADPSSLDLVTWFGFWFFFISDALATVVNT